MPKVQRVVIYHCPTTTYLQLALAAVTHDTEFEIQLRPKTMIIIKTLNEPLVLKRVRLTPTGETAYNCPRSEYPKAIRFETILETNVQMFDSPTNISLDRRIETSVMAANVWIGKNEPVELLLTQHGETAEERTFAVSFRFHRVRPTEPDIKTGATVIIN